MPNAVLERLETERTRQLEFVDELLARVAADERDLVDAERGNLEAARERIGQLDAQLEPLRQFETLRGTHQGAIPAPPAQRTGSRTASLGVTERAHAYRSAGEIIVDRIRAFDVMSNNVFGEEDSARGRAALERLQRAGLSLPGSERGNWAAPPNQTTAETPGLLPEPIIGEIVNDLDGQRPFITSLGGARPLGNIPGKTFSRPTVTQHVTVGKQSAEKTALPSQQFTVDGVDFAKETWGGWLNVSRQDIDWTSPAAWDAIVRDLQDVYGLVTDGTSARAFATAITQASAAVATDDLAGWAAALYEGAALAYAGGADVAAGEFPLGRLPDHIWVSLDMWAKVGAIVDQARLVFPPTQSGNAGESSITSFDGNMFQAPRTVVPSLPAGTVIIGSRGRTEVYEALIGLLSAVEPSVLGVQIAYAGYFAYGTVAPLAFAKVTPPAETP